MFSLNHIRETWAQFAREFGAEHAVQGAEAYVDLLDKVIYRHKDFQITMDYWRENKYAHTRIYVPVTLKDSFNLAIFKDSFLWKIDKFFGMQDVTVGDAEIDETFVVQTNNEAETKQFLANPKIRELLFAIQPYTVPPRFTVGEYEFLARTLNLNGGTFISVMEAGSINNVERLKAMFGLIIETIEHLISTGAISVVK